MLERSSIPCDDSRLSQESITSAIFRLLLSSVSLTLFGLDMGIKFLKILNTHHIIAYINHILILKLKKVNKNDIMFYRLKHIQKRLNMKNNTSSVLSRKSYARANRKNVPHKESVLCSRVYDVELKDKKNLWQKITGRKRN